jgi:hypothetical protein
MSAPQRTYRAASSCAHTPPGYPLRPFHVALVFTELLGRIRPSALTPAWLALAAIACWPWSALRLPAAILSLAFTLLDWASLALLPRLKRSFGPVTPPLLALAFVRTALTFTAGLLWDTQAALLLSAGVNLAISATSLYATWIEPFRLEATEIELRSSKLNSGADAGQRKYRVATPNPCPTGSTPLRLLHITDLHVERITSREEKLLQLVEVLAPDVTVLTGDYLNLEYVYDSTAQSETRDLLARLCDLTRGPVYAITGSPPVDRRDVVPAIFERLPITWLQDEVGKLHLKGCTLWIVGLNCTRRREEDASRLRRLLDDNPGRGFTLLLYHSPDLMPEAVELDVDLYLCGHTHGGQIRLPFLGALITSSDFWKRYEMGRYNEGPTTLYVNRGLGMEGMGAPRARFLAPPEVVLWNLSP